MNIHLTIDQFDELESAFPEFTYRNSHTDQYALVTGSTWDNQIVRFLAESKIISTGEVATFRAEKVHMLVFKRGNNSPGWRV